MSSLERNTRVHTINGEDYEKTTVDTKMSVQGQHSDGKYRTVLREFAENSSAGGISKVFSSKTLLIRSTWIILCIACYGAMVFLSLKLIEQYLGKPTATFVDVTFERDMSFPSVTVCNLNKFRRSTLRSNLPKVNEVLMNYRRHASKLDRAGQSWKNTDERKQLYIQNMYAKSGIKNQNVIHAGSVDRGEILKTVILQKSTLYSQEDLSKSGHQFQNLVADCRWMGVKCNEGYFSIYWKHIWNWKYGNCYAFNFGLDSNGSTVQLLRTTKAGPSHGLQLDVFLEQHEYIPELSTEAGIKVVIVDHKQHPFPFHEGVAVSPGTATSIALRKEVIERVDPFENNTCVGDSVVKENIYSRDGKLIYTVQSCLDTCIVKLQQRECNCTHPQYPRQGKICSTKEEFVGWSWFLDQCITTIHTKYRNDGNGCIKTCPQRCRSVSYRTTLSNSEMASQFQDAMRTKLSSDSKFKKYVKTGEDFKKDFLRLKIYFEELNLVRIHQQFSYSVSNLLADIGGQLGLWVGLSVITFAEVGDLLLSLIILMFSKN